MTYMQYLILFYCIFFLQTYVEHLSKHNLRKCLTRAEGMKFFIKIFLQFHYFKTTFPSSGAFAIIILLLYSLLL